MTYGLEVKNAAGDLLASSAGPCLHYHGKATLYATGRVQPSGALYAYFSIAGLSPTEPPVVFARVPAGQRALITQIRWESTINAWRVAVFGTAYASVELLAFRPLPPTARQPAGPYGLQLLNEVGDVMLDSTRNPLVISEAFEFTGNVSYPTTTTIRTLEKTYVSPAYIVNPAIIQAGAPGAFVGLGIAHNGPTFSLAWVPCGTGTSFPDSWATAAPIAHTVLVIETQHLP